MKKINLLVLLSVLAFNLFSQNIEFDKVNFPDKTVLKKLAKQLKEANQLFQLGVYDQAKEEYNSLNNVNANNSFVNMRIGVCLLNSSSKITALPFFKKSLELDKANTEINYYLGRTYQYKGEFEKAISHYKESEKADSKKDVISNIKECEYGLQYLLDRKNVEIKNLGTEINSKYADYSPLISADGSFLVFTSRREESTGGQIDPAINSYYEDIYFSEKKDGKWSSSTNIGAPINTEYHDATVGLSADGQQLFIYNDNDGSGDIYECTLNGENWSEPVKLPEAINSKYNEYTASFSPDGNSIYFVSDKPGGIGGKDIYVSFKNNKSEWEAPQNLGGNINTKLDEDAIFMHADGKTIYFSSKGHQSMGGYDIYKSLYDKDKKEWSAPINLGYPINSADDDIFFVIAANGKTAFYTSKKEGGIGGADIYEITFKEDTTAKTPQLTLLKGVVSDEDTKVPLLAKIEITDNLTGEIISTFQSNEKTGKYLISLPSGKNYGISVSAEDHLFHSENFNISDSSGYNEITKNISLKKIAVGKKIVLQNIFFTSGKSDLRNESKAELTRLVNLIKENKTIKIEISGHTDNVGSSESNRILSKKRAEAVVTYLTDNGISKDKLIAKGYGENNPVTENETEQGRQKNRRTEFKVLSKTD